MEFLKYGLGIDMAMEKFDACISIIDKQQRVTIRAQCSFNNNKKGFETFLSWVTKNTKFDIPAAYLMEATGIYYEQFKQRFNDMVNELLSKDLASGKANALTK